MRASFLPGWGGRVVRFRCALHRISRRLWGGGGATHYRTSRRSFATATAPARVSTPNLP